MPHDAALSLGQYAAHSHILEIVFGVYLRVSLQPELEGSSCQMHPVQFKLLHVHCMQDTSDSAAQGLRSCRISTSPACLCQRRAPTGWWLLELQHHLHQSPAAACTPAISKRPLCMCMRAHVASARLLLLAIQSPAAA